MILLRTLKRMLAMISFFTMLLPGSIAFSENDIIDSGTLYPNGTWTLMGDGAFRLEGKGSTYYSNRADVPWYKSMDRIISAEIGPEVEQLGNYVFCDAENMCQLTLPEGLEWIGLRAFSDCKSLTSIELPASVKSIDYWAFAGCSALREIVAGGNLDEISNYTFQDCEGLLRAVFLEPVRRLGYDSLENCYALRELYLPSSIQIIDSYALNNCYSLTDIYYAGSREQWLQVTVADHNFSALSRATVHYDCPYSPDNVTPLSSLTVWPE